MFAAFLKVCLILFQSMPSMVKSLHSPLQIPAHPNAPLLKPAVTSQWPLVIFSHGLGGSRTAYRYTDTSLPLCETVFDVRQSILQRPGSFG